MAGWAGVALALRRADEEALASRLPAHLHPLAGRSLVWHVLHAMGSLEPAPRQLLLVSASRMEPSVVSGLAAEPLEVAPRGPWWPRIAQRFAADVDRVLIVDAAAPALYRSLAGLIAGPPGRALRNADGTALALWLARAHLERVEPAAPMQEVATDCDGAPAAEPSELLVVRDRSALARAGVLIRDRLVQRLMAGGVTFLLPESVLVDVDVVVGPDTVVYPGVVLEGETHVGAETVIGPGCRIIDSRVGTGVELKGWNYLVGTTIRNRAVLEPYVRRGFD